MEAMQHVCVWAAAGESLLHPPTWVFSSSSSLRSLSQTTIGRDRRGSLGEQQARQQIEMDGEN